MEITEEQPSSKDWDHPMAKYQGRFHGYHPEHAPDGKLFDSQEHFQTFVRTKKDPQGWVDNPGKFPGGYVERYTDPRHQLPQKKS